MSAVTDLDVSASALDAPLDPEHEARVPPEVRGAGRDDVRLLVSEGDDRVTHARFSELPRFLHAGDSIVVNRSATIPASIAGRLPDGTPIRVHFSTELPGGFWLVEARTPAGSTTVPNPADLTGATVELAGGGSVVLLDRFAESRRLWLAAVHLEPDVVRYLTRHGEPIRYRHAPDPWPLDAYQQVFGSVPGSAEMPSASRPFTPEIVVDLARRGVTIVPILLHAGVSSLEAHESPYPERYEVPAATAAHVNAVHGSGGRVVAIGTTVVRALETVVDDRGVVHPGEGWTDVVVTPARGVRAVDGLLTGWHEPEASHLLMLEAVAGRPALQLAYTEARMNGYLWHEFGDSHLLLPERDPGGRP
ncbi:MAG TPA: S-adenosylmethionine:tRNA ribosyltransferase-isomerase [Acidimicrobiia bacterium]|nr:S-adenosylmethionine:tRNA ribosyltransferase-isomerase [Acidimicrobiia bacterium]